MAINKTPLKVALHGVDPRCTKTMMLFLQGPCNNAATVVQNTEDAHIDIFDSDSSVSKNLLATHLQGDVQKPVIVLSLQDFEYKGILSLKKPVKTDDMLMVLNRAKKLIGKSLKTSINKLAATPKAADSAPPKAIEEHIVAVAHESVIPEQPPIPEPELTSPSPQAEIEELRQQVVEVEDKALKTFVYDKDEREKTAKHQTAMRLDEKSFHSYIGSIDDVDVNDPEQFGNAHYDSANYYQGIVQSAVATCRGKNKIFSLHSIWKPITIFPRTQEIWLDGSEAELKIFAGIKLKHRKGKQATPRLTPVDPEVANIGGNLNQFQSMEAFLWKLACWTSMGRYPKEIDYKKPVYLKNWPNFTRLLITPHALRIAALLVQSPRTMGNIAETLNIKPQYVFVFISAAYAVGLSGQARRLSDSLVEALTKERKINADGLVEALTKERRITNVIPLNSIMNKLRDNST